MGGGALTTETDAALRGPPLRRSSSNKHPGTMQFADSSAMMAILARAGSFVEEAVSSLLGD